MIGQGGPKPSHADRPSQVPKGARRGAWLALVLAVVANGPVHAGQAGQVNLRIRAAWGGGAERIWHGTITLNQGQLADPEPLGIEADEPGSMWLEPAGSSPPAGQAVAAPADTPPEKPGPAGESTARLVIRGRSRRTYDAVDFSVTAPPNATLHIALAPADESQPPRAVVVRLADLLRASFSAELDDRGNRLVVQRCPGDDLRVRLSRGALVYRPDEVFQCELLAHLPSLESGTKVRIKLQLRPARGGQELWSDERTVAAGDPAPVAIEVPLAKCSEGAYELAITASHAGKIAWPPLRPQLGFRSVLAERIVEFLVLHSKPPVPARAEGQLETVVEIDPASPGWWERLGRLPALARLPRLGKGPLGNGNLRVVSHPLGALAQLAPSKPDDPSWEAYMVPVARPGEPHLLEVEYPSDVPQTLGISIIEANEAGAVVPVGLDSGVDHPEPVTGVGAAPRWLRHRLVFWPRTRTPVVLMTNRRQDRPAVYGRIRVRAGWGRLPRAFGSESAPERLLAAYFDRPLFAENFSASESVGSLSDLTVDDWTTFYEGATRLIEYLHYVGYNGTMLSVLADGSSLYPSQLLQPTPRYDTGVFFAAGQDPVRKDVLEMLLRLLDREGLQFVAAVEFASPLPALEARIREGGPQAEGLQWIGPDGLPWTHVYLPQRGRAPYYNVLDPRVQEAMLAVVREITSRYAQHPSLAGIALQLSAYGYAQLPGPQWGLDDVTIARFEQQTGVRLPTVAGPERYRRRLEALAPVGPDGARQWRREWLQWRATQMSRFYRQVYEALSAARPGTRLFLAGGDMFAGPPWDQELRPSLPCRATLAETMLRAGIEPHAFGEDRGIVLLQSTRIGPAAFLSRQATTLELAQLPDAERYFQTLWPSGALLFHPPLELRVASFDEKSPFRPCYAWLAAQIVPSDIENRRRFVHALASLDPQAIFDGGWMLPMGQEESLRGLVAVFRQLPAVRFERAPPAPDSEGQPAVVRFATRGDRTYAYVVNEAPFATTLRVRVAMPTAAQLEPLVAGRSVGPLRRDSLGTYWEVALDPYDVIGAWFSAPNVRLSGVQVAVTPEIRAALEKRLSDLGDRVAALGNPPLLEALSNPGFDAPTGQGGPIPGWTPFGGPGIVATLDATTRHNGTHALRLASQGPPGGVASLPFAAPRTGRLSLSVWLRVADAGRQPPLRLTVAGKVGSRDFFRSAWVGQSPEVAGVPGIPAEWTQFYVHVFDLPLESSGYIHLRFELTGPGEVWIDDVQLCELFFTEKERKALVRLLTPADVMLQNGQVGDSLRLLEGYWSRFLVEHVPLPQTPVVQKPEPPASPAGEPAARSARLLDRLKQWSPERLR